MLSIGKLGSVSSHRAASRSPALTSPSPRRAPDSERDEGLKKMIGALVRPERTIKGKTDPQQRQLAIAS